MTEEASCPYSTEQQNVAPICNNVSSNHLCMAITLKINKPLYIYPFLALLVNSAHNLFFTINIAANMATAKLTNQFKQTRLRKFD